MANGDGFIVMVKVMGVPVQKIVAGVTVMVAVMFVAPVFVAVNDGMKFAPEAASPMAGFEFVHVNEAPGEPLKSRFGTVAAEHTVVSGLGLTMGCGRISTFSRAVFVQPLAAVTTTV